MHPKNIDSVTEILRGFFKTDIPNYQLYPESYLYYVKLYKYLKNKHIASSKLVTDLDGSAIVTAKGI